MLFLTVSAEEFALFIQTLLWVFLPLAVISISIATYIHYRRKRKAGKGEEGFSYPENDAYAVMPASKQGVDSENPEEGYKGVLWMRNKYEQDLARMQQKNDQIQHDFDRLEKKYLEALARGSRNPGSLTDEAKTYQLQKAVKEYELKIARLEQAVEFLKDQKQESNGDEHMQIHQPVQAAVTVDESGIRDLENKVQSLTEELDLKNREADSRKVEMDELAARFRSMEDALKNRELQYARESNPGITQKQEEERRLLEAKLSEKENALKELEEENEFLQQQLHAAALPVHNSNNATLHEEKIMHLEDEKKAFRERIIELESIQDMLAEKEQLITLLQQQLAQRVKSFHQLEHRTREDISSKEQQEAVLSGQVNELRDHLQSREEMNDQLKSRVEEIQHENKLHQEAIVSKTGYIQHLENSLEEIKDQYQEAKSLADQKHGMMMNIQSQLDAEKGRAKHLESKLDFSSQLLMKIYRELAKSLEKGNTESDGIQNSLEESKISAWIESPINENHFEASEAD